MRYSVEPARLAKAVVFLLVIALAACQSVAAPTPTEIRPTASTPAPADRPISTSISLPTEKAASTSALELTQTPTLRATPTSQATTPPAAAGNEETAWITESTITEGEIAVIDAAANSQSELGWYHAYSLVGDEAHIVTDDGAFVVAQDAVVGIVGCVPTDCQKTTEYWRSTYSLVDVLDALPPGSAIYVNPNYAAVDVFVSK